MEERSGWMKERDQICYPVERYLLGFAVPDKERLISAIISNAFLNEKTEYDQLRKIPADPGLETIGDFVLDFVIIDHFAREGKYSAKEINDFRQFYGRNDALHAFAKDRLRLHAFILWGPDEGKRMIWDLPGTTILADRFEMLVAVIYLERGIEAVKDFLKNTIFSRRLKILKNKSDTSRPGSRQSRAFSGSFLPEGYVTGILPSGSSVYPVAMTRRASPGVIP